MPDQTRLSLNLFNRFPLLEFLFVLACVLITRLPYLLSSHVYFDGDEAMIGIMARDLLSGNGIPVYFYGQQYGFSFFEVLSAAICLPFFGSGLLSLKFGGILLFSIGIWRLVYTVRKRNLPPHVYFLILATLVLFPAWIVWATKLRGGYITAFVALAFIYEQVVLHQDWRLKQWLVVASAFALTAVAQPLFLLPVIPLLLYRFIRSTDKPVILKAGLWGLLVLVVLWLPSQLNNDFWQPQHVGTFKPELITGLFLKDFISHFSGYYMYGVQFRPTNLVYGALSSALVIGAVFFFSKISRLSFRPKKETLLILAGTMLVPLILPWAGISGGRFLLAFHSGLILITCHLLINGDTIAKKSTTTVLIIGVALLAIGLTGFEKFTSYWLEPQVNDMEVLEELVTALHDEEIQHVFVTEWHLIWQLNYLGDEKLAARSLHRFGRIDRYAERVDSCYLDPNCTYALAGTHWPLLGLDKVEGWSETVTRVNERYYLMPSPEKKFLDGAGFLLAPANE